MLSVDSYLSGRNRSRLLGAKPVNNPKSVPDSFFLLSGIALPRPEDQQGIFDVENASVYAILCRCPTSTFSTLSLPYFGFGFQVV